MKGREEAGRTQTSPIFVPSLPFMERRSEETEPRAGALGLSTALAQRQAASAKPLPSLDLSFFIFKGRRLN